MARQLKDEDRSLWRAAMRGVKPLPTARHASEESPPIPRRPEPHDGGAPVRTAARLHGEAAKSARAAGGIDRRTLTRIKRGELGVDARLDLHGLTQEAAHRALVRFIATAAADGARLALVITGKGRSGEGVLRAAVPRWLAEPATHARILAVTPAPPQLGGSGALCVLLRRARERAVRT
ncbi:MAG TPA: Smr/MutS family protein [Stellaceae bacterium]|nr:Smr/MutS family protein [Stellaceae bacterium]